MKTLKTSLFISFALFVQVTVKAQLSGAIISSSTIAATTTTLGSFTSNALAAALTNETGSGAAVFGTSPVFITKITTPFILGGITTTTSVTYKTTSAVGTTGADHIFVVGNNGATEAMRIINSGFVGIGNPAPSQKLDVNGNIVLGTPSAFTAGTSGILQFRRPSDGNVPLLMGLYSDTEFSFRHQGGNGFFSFWTAGAGAFSEKMRLDYNGNLFIGSNVASNTPALLNFRRMSDGAAVVSMGCTSSTSEEFTFTNPGGSGCYTFWTAGGTGYNEKMRIAYDGSVGIGTPLTSNPNGYKLAVNGTIGAKAIKVETSSGWPDFVFEKNYQLKTIPELEAFIKTNKHLPNVPSACEVEEKGIDIATMDATLLAKIEELSLYIIELNKQFAVQKEKIECLEKKISK